MHIKEFYSLTQKTKNKDEGLLDWWLRNVVLDKYKSGIREFETPYDIDMDSCLNYLKKNGFLALEQNGLIFISIPPQGK